MIETSPEPWDPVSPTYQFTPRGDVRAIDTEQAVAALAQHGVARAAACEALRRLLATGSALVQCIDADWKRLIADLDAAGVRVQVWMGW